MSKNVNQKEQICNAPRWKFKIPKKIPPKFSLNSHFPNSNKHFELQNNLQNQNLPLENLNNCSLSTNSESDDEYQTKISILSLLEKKQ